MNEKTTSLEPLLNLVSEMSSSLVSEIQTSLKLKLADGSLKANEDYDQIDLDNYMKYDWQIYRYLLMTPNHDKNKTVDTIISTLKWRKKMNVNNLCPEMFPSEYYSCGGIFQLGRDMSNHELVVFRVKVNRRISDFSELLKKYVIFIVEQLDASLRKSQSVPDHGISMLFDCTHTGLTNVDLDLVSFIIGITRDHYPKFLINVYIHELPPILSFVVKLASSWLPEEDRLSIKLTNNKTINDWIKKDELPDFLGGLIKGSKKYCIVPKGALSVMELGLQLGVKKKSIDKLMEQLKPFINELETC